MSLNITMIGCGKMGGALLTGWLETLPNCNFNVIKPTPLKKQYADKVIYKSNIESGAAILQSSDIVILAVKPQIIFDVTLQLKPFITATTLIISIAAGTSLENLANALPAHQPIIRTMPNTPAAIGKGMSVAVANDHTNQAHIDQTTALFESVGKLEWLDTESLINAATALMGNGPAYLFHLIETMTNAGLEAGLDANLSAKLARQTVIGAAALAEQNPETPAATLRENVTSPGGTTAAALEILMNGEMQSLMTKAVAAGKKRSEELS